MFQIDPSPRKFFGSSLVIFILGLWLASLPLHAAAQSATESRHQLVLRELELTPSEEKSFWPIYDEYATELLHSFEETAEVAYRLFQTRTKVSDAMADEYTLALLNGELRQSQIYLEYLPKFRFILDARRTARLFQFERRLHSFMYTEISREFPMVR